MGSDNRPPYYALYYIIFQSTLPAGGATVRPLRQAACTRFQSTLPVGGATSFPYCNVGLFRISIHAPRRGSDGISVGSWYLIGDFNPRSPHGERHAGRDLVCRHYIFQSTLPAWGATSNTIPVMQVSTISIHAPRMGSDHIRLKRL